MDTRVDFADARIYNYDFRRSYRTLHNEELNEKRELVSRKLGELRHELMIELEKQEELIKEWKLLGDTPILHISREIRGMWEEQCANYSTENSCRKEIEGILNELNNLEYIIAKVKWDNNNIHDNLMLVKVAIDDYRERNRNEMENERQKILEENKRLRGRIKELESRVERLGGSICGE